MCPPATKPTIAVTLGDPAGVGPELCLRLIEKAYRDDLPYRPIIFGDLGVLRQVAERIDSPLRKDSVRDLRNLDSSRVEPGKIQAECGRAAGESIRAAVEGCRSGEFAAVVTAPIQKESLHLGGFDYPGHTEMIADLLGVRGREAMLLTSSSLSVAFATLHVSLAAAAKTLRSEEIVRVGRLAAEWLESLRGQSPRVGVLALNPHAGEGGLMGDEEQRLIRPALEALRRAGIRAEGPLVPDAAFTDRLRARFDVFVAMYHDQGSIPFKMLAFEEGVNVTMGLPIVRTSPDHGTAFDIAWKGIASPSSFFAAADLAARLVRAGPREGMDGGARGT